MQTDFATNKDVSLWTVRTSAGAPLVLCSGGPGCCDYLAPVASLVEACAEVIRFDARGCGRSTHAATYNVETCVEDLEIVRRHYGIERWIVAGHSWGADLALIYALHYPEQVRGIICLAGGRLNNDREWHAAYTRGRDAGLEPDLDYDYAPNLDVNAQVNLAAKRYIQRPTLWREVAQLQAPALFIYGDQDIRPSWPVEQVANLLPNGRFVMLSGAQHALWQSHADDVGDLIREFVQQI